MVGKCVLKGMSYCRLAPGPPPLKVAVFVPCIKGAPASVRLYQGMPQWVAMVSRMHVSLYDAKLSRCKPCIVLFSLKAQPRFASYPINLWWMKHALGLFIVSIAWVCWLRQAHRYQSNVFPYRFTYLFFILAVATLVVKFLCMPFSFRKGSYIYSFIDIFGMIEWAVLSPAML